MKNLLTVKPGRPLRAHLPHYTILGLWTIVVFFPLWTMVINSFKKRLAIYKDPFGLPKEWDFSSYGSVFQDGNFFVYFKNSVTVAVGCILIILLLGSLASYALANWRTKLSRFFYLFFIAGMMIPIKIGSINLLFIVKKLGLLNSTASLFPIYVAMGMPMAILILTEFIRSIPKEITEAAVIDGASRMRIFWSIVFHLIRPGLGTVAIFNLVPIWNDLWFPLIFISKENQKTLILGVTRLFGQYQTDWSKVLAVLTLSAVPILILYLLMAKQFIRGLTAGAVKG